MNLIYIADPMCSWCYGFGAPMQQLLDEAAEPVELTLLMGGLRPYTTEPLSAARADELCGYWARVADASGQPFCQPPHTAMHEAGFVYDTEPASRATVTVRNLWPEHTWAYFKAVQRAFYAQARNVTQTEVLADLAAGLGLPRDEFSEAFEAEAMDAATRQDFAQTQAWGISGFPALVAESNGQLHLLAKGFMPYPALQQQLQRLAALKE